MAFFVAFAPQMQLLLKKHNVAKAPRFKGCRHKRITKRVCMNLRLHDMSVFA